MPRPRLVEASGRAQTARSPRIPDVMDRVSERLVSIAGTIGWVDEET